MSVEIWKAEAIDIGLNKSDTQNYILNKQREQATQAEHERDMQRQAHELEMQRLQAERQKEREEHELRIAQLRAESMPVRDDSENAGRAACTPSLHRLKLPVFRERDRIEIFISRFEEIAHAVQMDEVTKRVQFLSLFEGQALEVLHRLDEESRDYENMKEALLSAYGLSTDELKRQFFSAGIKHDETPSQFASRIRGYFDQWRRKDGSPDTAEGIKDLVLRAQFVKSCPEELVSRMKMNKINSLDAMKEASDSYFEACGKRRRPGVPGNSFYPNHATVPFKGAGSSEGRNNGSYRGYHGTQKGTNASQGRGGSWNAGQNHYPRREGSSKGSDGKRNHNQAGNAGKRQF